MTVDLIPSLTDEQAMLVDASERFMDAAMPLAMIRARADDDSPLDPDYARTAADLGWFGLLADEGQGGGSVSGNGLVDAAIIAAERGARLQPGPYPGHSVVVEALSRAAADGVAHPALADLLTGEGWATWSGTDGPPGRLERDGDGLRLTAKLDVVAGGPACRWVLVVAEGPDGRIQVLVPTDRSGVQVRPLKGFDVTRRWAALDLDGVAVDPADVVGTPGDEAESEVARLGQVAAVLSAAEAVGAMDADHRLATQYAKDRIAFGRPIGSFQAIKHLLADTSLLLEMAKGAVAEAAIALGSGRPRGPELAHAAKAFVAEQSIELGQACFQVFGGIGYTWEHDQHLYLRRLAAEAQCFGSAAWHRDRLLDAAGFAA